MSERPAGLGELCVCGRQAVTVFVGVREIGYCGAFGPPRVAPCPFCGATEPHRAPWGDPEVCPDYRVRPESV